MTKQERKVYRRVMRRFASGKLRARNGRLIRTEATARRLARNEMNRAQKD